MVHVNWKELSQSPGYKSLKAAMIHDMRKNWYSKKKCYELFRFVIGRAMHYAHKTGTPPEFYLNHWEKYRGYWWRNYYSDYNQPKIGDTPKTLGLKGWIRKDKESGWLKPGNDTCHRLIQESKRLSPKKRNRGVNRKPKA